jgi:hypothetical protein
MISQKDTEKSPKKNVLSNKLQLKKLRKISSKTI